MFVAATAVRNRGALCSRLGAQVRSSCAAVATDIRPVRRVDICGTSRRARLLRWPKGLAALPEAEALDTKRSTVLGCSCLRRGNHASVQPFRPKATVKPVPKMSDKELQKKIKRQMEADFRADPLGFHEKHGLTASLHRGVVACVVVFCIVLFGFLIWSILRH
ncbi:hypothetical protein EOD04_00325 [Mesorhizobium sp. M2C.T.Ca.TU.009.01.2.1]|nr:hypothetical protein EOD04_00325 [Mesorhizobium sp. M2C.T.Ca.TU.009.01.2.1]